MRYHLRTLMIAAAIAPPALGFTVMMRDRPLVAGLALFWAGAFFVSITSKSWTRTRLGLSTSEWLVLVAIVACMADLCLRFDPCYYYGCRE